MDSDKILDPTGVRMPNYWIINWRALFILSWVPWDALSQRFMQHHHQMKVLYLVSGSSMTRGHNGRCPWPPYFQSLLSKELPPWLTLMTKWLRRKKAKLCQLAMWVCGCSQKRWLPLLGKALKESSLRAFLNRQNVWYTRSSTLHEERNGPE